MKSIFKAGKWYVFASLFVKGINALTLPIYTNIMSPAETGTYTALNNIKNFIPLLISLALDGAFVYFFHKSKNNKAKLTEMFSTTFWFVIFFGSVMSTLLYFVLHYYMPNYDSFTIFFVVFPPITFQLGMLGIAFFNQSLESYKTTLFQIVATLIGSGISIYFVLQKNLSYQGRLIGDAFMAFVLMSMVIIYFAQAKILTFKINFTYLKEALKFSFPLIPASFAAWINTQSSQLFLQKFFPNKSEAGLFGVAASIASLMYYAMDAITQVLNPVVMSGLMNDRERTHKKIRELMLLFTIIFLFLHLLFLFFAKEITLIFTVNSKAFKNAHIYIAPLAVGYLFAIFHRLFATILAFHKKNFFSTYAVIIGSIILTILNIIFIPKFGPIVCSISILISTITYTIIEGYFAKKYENIKLGLKRYLKFILIYLLAGFIYFYFLNTPVFSYINFIIKIVIAFLVAIFYIVLGNYYSTLKELIFRKFNLIVNK